MARRVVAACLAAWEAMPAPAGPAMTCVLDGASVMAFGSYDPMSEVPLDLQGRVSYRWYIEHRAGIVSATPAVSTGICRAWDF